MDIQISDEERERYELTEEEASIIAGPFSRLFAATPINKRYGRTLLENKDALAAVIVLAIYIDRTRPLLVRKLKRNAKPAANVVNMQDYASRAAAAQQAAAQAQNNGGSSNGAVGQVSGAEQPPNVNPYGIDT